MVGVKKGGGHENPGKCISARGGIRDGCFPVHGVCTDPIRPEKSAMALRLPPMEAMDLSLRSERRELLPKPPYTVADESRGRWLTLFELTVSHLRTETLSETGSGKEGR